MFFFAFSRQNNSEQEKYLAFNSITPGNKILDNSFLDWFIGFTEGDGNFKTFKDSGKMRVSFTINQADLYVLKDIQEKFEFGNVTTFSQPNPSTKEISTYARYTVYESAAILALIELFNGNLYLEKVNTRFSRWVEIYNTHYFKNGDSSIMLKGRKLSSFITLENGWL